MADERHMRAPWNSDQIESLDGYQVCGTMHPFTCPNRGEHGGEGLLMATAEGWTCARCDYTQDWAWAWMANGEWLEWDRKIRDLIGAP